MVSNRQYLFCHNLISGLKLDKIPEIFFSKMSIIYGTAYRSRIK